jgi:glycerol-1-phosphate dehydrogenase [NAD(P)+]
MLVSELIIPDTFKAFEDTSKNLSKYYFYADNAIEQTARTLLNELGKNGALILADTRTYKLVGEQVFQVFSESGWNVQKLIIPDSGPGESPVCDDLTKNQIQQQLPEADLFLAVGSGVVNDLTKWLSAEAEKPYAVIATAASMNGYTAANVAPMIDGVKSLFRAKSPIAVTALPEIIENAPYELTASGLGDVIAKPVSTADWLVNNFLFGENFNRKIAEIISNVELAYLNHAAELKQKDPQAIKGLFESLLLSGCAMTLQGSSLPASGGEHLISHTLDIKAHQEGKKHDLHGRQVGVSSIFAAAVYHRLQQITPTFNPNALVLDEKYWGEVAVPVKKQYQGAIAQSRKAAEILSESDNWDKLMALLKPVLRTPQSIKTCLKTAGAAHCLDDIGCSRDQYLAAVLNSACMRERFTSMDLGFLAGILPNAIGEIIDEWLI